MTQMKRFEDALEQLAKASVGRHGDHYAYMTGYLLSLVNELSWSADGAYVLERSLRDTEKMLFERNTLQEVDKAA